MRHFIISLLLIVSNNFKSSECASAWEAVPGNEQMHQQNLNTTKTLGDKIKVIFFGDSITSAWVYGTGTTVWKKYYEPLPAVDYGVGGETTSNLIWHIQSGEVDGIHPKAVVVMIGTNNLSGGNSDDDIVKGITTIIDLLKKKLPSTKILQLGILPRGDYEPLNKNITNINSQVAKLTAITFLDMSSKFLLSTGKLNENLYTDKLHLTTAGYELWAETMNPTLNKLIA